MPKDEAKEEVTEEKAVFDFNRLYWSHQQIYSQAYRRAIAPTPSVEDVDAWEKQQLFVVQRALVSVPRELLRADAPANIDWQAEDATQWWTFGALEVLHAQFIDAYNDRQKKLVKR
jgi:hypothetical protein